MSHFAYGFGSCGLVQPIHYLPLFSLNFEELFKEMLSALKTAPPSCLHRGVFIFRTGGTLESNVTEKLST